jgi:hypothetical protein
MEQDNSIFDFTKESIVKGDKNRLTHCFFFYIFNKLDNSLLLKKASENAIVFPFYQLQKIGDRSFITPSAMLSVGYMKEEMTSAFKYITETAGANIQKVEDLKFIVSLRHDNKFVNHYLSCYVNQESSGKTDHKFITPERMKTLKLIDDTYKWLAPMSKYLLDHPEKKYDYVTINVK